MAAGKNAHFDNLARIWGQGIDAILPPRCAVSGAVVDKPGMLAPAAWAGLRLIAAPCCVICGYPFDFETESNATCAACLREAPLFSRARAALVYDDASRSMILRFKHGDQTQSALSFAPLLLRAGGSLVEEADLIVPVPLHRWRLLKRRYNQAALLAQALARAAVRPCLPDGLIRRRATASQGHRGFGERHRNVKGAFAVNPRQAARMAGKNILLIDDVYTSGATIHECAKILLRSAGAARVEVLTLARVVKPESAV